MKISLFIPCLVDQAYPETGLAAVRILERLGHEVIYDSRQTCCGQAPFNAGFRDEALILAKRFVRLFNDTEIVVGPSGSCVSMIRKHYAGVGLTGSYLREWETLRKRVFELTEFLVDKLGLMDVGAFFPHRVSIHNSCHALRDLSIKEQPNKLLYAVKGLELVEGKWEDECCGFGGVFSAKYPTLSSRIADRRAKALSEGKAEFITGVDDSCLHHLRQAFRRQNLPMKTIHVARILASD